MQVVMPVVFAIVFVLISSLIPEPARRRFHAILVAGAGAAYLNGGFGGWELAYTAAATYVAYRGLDSHRFIGLAWLMHSGWDLAHHAANRGILDFVPDSSLGCAISDPLIALWFLAGAPSLLRRGNAALPR